MAIIQTENLTKYYNQTRGIENITLTIQEGDFFGFIGPNGAGKSTLIRTLLGLISPSSGTASVLGMDIQKNKTEILKKVGYLPSETNLYASMRVSEIIRFSADLRNVDCSSEAKRLCEILELDPKRKVDELSLGNRKKVGIVCALQHKPSLYILDEPTSGLDPLMQRQLYTILQERNQEGATVFLSSHVLSEIGRYCKHAAVIRDGSIIRTDSVATLGHTGIKRVVLRGISTFLQMPHTADVHIENDTVRFLYSGSSLQLTKELATLNFEDITITDPDLEEVFLHYYQKEQTT